MFDVLFIAFGVAMDAFGISVALGGILKKFTVKGIISSVLFGTFQAGMPVIGWLIGETFKGFISGVDHWIAFFLLLGIGVKMIYVPKNHKRRLLKQKDVDMRLLLSLAFATSIDALIVGMGIALFGFPVYMTVGIIGLVTFLLSLSGVYIGTKYSKSLHDKTGIFGGAILIAIGIKILSDHLFFP